MRILFVSAPLVGHLYPMVPLAVALRAAGHDVLVASGGAAVSPPPAGLPVEDVAGRFDFGRIARRVMIRHPLVARKELAGQAGTDGVALLFGAVNDDLMPGVERVVERFRPHVVVHEPLAGAGAVAAAARGIPTALLGTSFLDDAELVRVTTAAMRRPRHLPMSELPSPVATYTLAPRSVLTAAYTIAPRGPAKRGVAAVRPLRPVPYGGDGDGDGDLPVLLSEPANRPRVLVSRSTVPGPGGGDLMAAVVGAAPDVVAEFVLVRPDDKHVRAGVPDNVRTVGWVPLAEALEGCAGIVHHGGAGTVLAAFAAGVPQIVVPGPGDRRHNAAVVAARGAGLAVPVKEITPAVLRRLVTDTDLAGAAGEVAAEIAAMPPPAEVAAAMGRELS